MNVCLICDVVSVYVGLVQYIEGIKSSHLKYWRSKRKEEERIVIALADFSYVVVLADRGEYVLLWTAYYVEQEHRRQKLRRECKAYMDEKC